MSDCQSVCLLVKLKGFKNVESGRRGIDERERERESRIQESRLFLRRRIEIEGRMKRERGTKDNLSYQNFHFFLANGFSSHLFVLFLFGRSGK